MPDLGDTDVRLRNSDRYEQSGVVNGWDHSRESINSSANDRGSVDGVVMCR